MDSDAVHHSDFDLQDNISQEMVGILGPQLGYYSTQSQTSGPSEEEQSSPSQATGDDHISAQSQATGDDRVSAQSRQSESGTCQYYGPNDRDEYAASEEYVYEYDYDYDYDYDTDDSQAATPDQSSQTKCADPVPPPRQGQASLLATALRHTNIQNMKQKK